MLVRCVTCKDRFDNGGYEWKRQCVSCFKKRKQREAKQEKTQWSTPESFGTNLDYDGIWLRENIKIVLALCHPDRHSNSEESNRVTRRLIEVYKRK